MCAKEEIKMKVMVGLFTTESNANMPGKNEIGSYDLGFGDDCVRKLRHVHLRVNPKIQYYSLLKS